MIPYDFPIPIVDNAPTAANYHDVPIDFRDTRYGEPLVDARVCGIAGENYYSRSDGQNPPYRQAIKGAICELWCRQSILAKLAGANELLSSYGAELFLWDAYRPIACQRGLWDFFFTQFRAEMPNSTDREVVEKVRQYVSDPTSFDAQNPATWPVHTTGAAVDLTLRDIRTKKLLDMGAGFDEMSSISHSDHFERLLRHGRIGEADARLRNRRLLHWAMKQQGFTNYFYEFWHFDYGDQMYIMTLARLQGSQPTSAWYGFIAPPSVT
jgi:zinc D-Ala-D-Ala dipeptidase